MSERKQIIHEGKNKLRARVVMEEHIGRKLLSSEWVHHINRDPGDDRIENLVIMTPEEHYKEHSRSEEVSPPQPEHERMTIADRIALGLFKER